MFIRKKQNSSGSLSIQIISKFNGRYKFEKTIGCAITRHEIEILLLKARQELNKLTKQTSLFNTEQDILIEKTFSQLQNSNIQTVGPEIIF
jgi:hypothetical protein